VNTALTVIAFLIGLVVVVYACFKLGSLMPFSVAEMRARREAVATSLEGAGKAEARLAEVRAEIDAEIARASAQAEEILDRARREAVAVAEETATRARREAAAFIERAHNDVAVERDRAVSDLRRELGALVVEGAGAVLRDAIDEPTHARLIGESLNAVKPPSREGA
jgi:F-type H+-transporting ATPase subunit b